MAPRSVVVDDGVEAHFFTRLLPAGIKAEAGVLIGRVAPKRSFVAAAVPTPSVGGATPLIAPAVAPANAKRPPPKATVDADLLAEHARQVAGLLPGGLAVVGVYAYVSGGLAAAVDGLAAAWAAAVTPSADGAAPPVSPIGLMLGVDTITRKLGLRETEAGAVKTAEVRVGKVVGSLLPVTASYPLAAVAPVSEGSVLKALQSAVTAEGKRASASVAVVAGSPLSPSAPAAPALAAGKPAPDGGGVEVTLLPPAGCDGAWSTLEAAATPAPTSVRLGGWVRARALIHDRDAGADVVAALAADVGATLAARLAAAARDAEDAGGGVGVLTPPPAAGAGAASHPLSRRGWWTLTGPITVGELALPGGGVDDDVAAVADAADQLLGRGDPLTAADVSFGEAAARSAPTQAAPRKPQGAAAASAAATATTTTAATPPQQAIAIVAALLVAAAAIVAALVLRAAGGAGAAAAAGLDAVGGEV